MKRAWPATAVVALLAVYRIAASESPRNIVGLDYAKSTRLVAAMYEGGQVTVWDLESGRVKNVLNAFGLRGNLNKPVAHFSPDGKRIAYTNDGDAGLVVYDLEKATSSPVVPHRMLYLGIAAFRWSEQDEALLVALGRDVLLASTRGRILWQRRLETHSVITDVVWHPEEHFYTVATDDSTVSSYDSVTGQAIASIEVEPGTHGAAVKLGWSKDGRVLIAGMPRKALTVLDANTLKVRKSIPCNCADFDWNPARRELAATGPSNISLFADLAPKPREVRTAADASGPVLWTDGNSVLTASAEAAVVLREIKTGKVVKTLVAGAK